VPANRTRKLEKTLIGSVAYLLGKHILIQSCGFRPVPKVKLAKKRLIPRLSGSFGIMTVPKLSTILAMGQPAQPGQQSPPAWTSMVPLVLLVIVFYFALIRPQQKKQRLQAELLKAVRAGDKIMTASGILGTVITVKEKSITIRSADAKFEIAKSAVAEITERSGESSES
jgi:preprotein translocase subunit YajC